MRFALVLLLLVLAGCERQQVARVERGGLMEGPEMFYICSTNGEQAMIYVDMDGDVWAPVATGRGCDYERQRLWWLAHPEYAYALHPSAPSE